MQKFGKSLGEGSLAVFTPGEAPEAVGLYRPAVGGRNSALKVVAATVSNGGRKSRKDWKGGREKKGLVKGKQERLLHLFFRLSLPAGAKKFARAAFGTGQTRFRGRPAKRSARLALAPAGAPGPVRLRPHAALALAKPPLPHPPPPGKEKGKLTPGPRPSPLPLPGGAEVESAALQ